MRIRTLFPTSLGLLVLAGSAFADTARSLDQKVKQFVEAANRQDVETMVGAVEPRFRWMQIDGEKLQIEVVGAEQLRSWLDGYFQATPSARTRISEVQVDGAFASTVEHVEFRDSKGVLRKQSATCVYEFGEAGLIRNVWYFPAQEDDAHADALAGEPR